MKKYKRDATKTQENLKKSLSHPELNELCKKLQPLNEPSETGSIVSNQDYYLSQRKQIITVVGAYFTVNLIDIIWKIIFINNNFRDFSCSNKEKLVFF